MHIEPFHLERYFAKYEFAVDYLLGSSDCESWSVGELLALEPGADERFREQWLGYTEYPGSPSLRAAICDLYESTKPEQVIVHSGAQEAIFLFMHAVLQPGDHVIVHWPCYQSLTEAARNTGAEVSLWQARPEHGWALDLDELKSLLKPNTRAVVVNTPHNPTGYLMSKADWRRLHEFVQEHDLLLFSDEVYRESEHDPADRLSAACDMGKHAVSLGVMSKSYGLAGLRIGWLATKNRDILQKVAVLKDYTTICNSSPSEFLAELALHHRQELLERNQTIILKNLDILDSFFSRHQHLFEWQRPCAGAIAFPALSGADVDVFCDDLVQSTGVMLVPGTIYGDAGNHFRIGFGRKNMPEAVAHLEDYLADTDSATR